MRDAASGAGLLAKFTTIGVQIAMDDFGTGNSSLSYLSQLPIDVLKIHRVVRQGKPMWGGGNRVIVSVVLVGMGENVRQRVIAEGVEKSSNLHSSSPRMQQGPE